MAETGRIEVTGVTDVIGSMVLTQFLAGPTTNRSLLIGDSGEVFFLTASNSSESIFLHFVEQDSNAVESHEISKRSQLHSLLFRHSKNASKMTESQESVNQTQPIRALAPNSNSLRKLSVKQEKGSQMRLTRDKKGFRMIVYHAPDPVAESSIVFYDLDSKRDLVKVHGDAHFICIDQIGADNKSTSDCLIFDCFSSKVDFCQTRSDETKQLKLLELHNADNMFIDSVISDACEGVIREIQFW